MPIMPPAFPMMKGAAASQTQMGTKKERGGGGGVMSKEEMDAAIAAAIQLSQRPEFQIDPPDTSKMRRPTKPETPPTEMTDEQTRALRLKTIGEGFKNLARIAPNANRRWGPTAPIGSAHAGEKGRLDRNRAEARQLMNDFHQRETDFDNQLIAAKEQFRIRQDEQSANLIATVVREQMQYKATFEREMALLNKRQELGKDMDLYQIRYRDYEKALGMQQKYMSSELAPYVNGIAEADRSIQKIDDELTELIFNPDVNLSDEDIATATKRANDLKAAAQEARGALHKDMKDHMEMIQGSPAYEMQLRKIEDIEKDLETIGGNLGIGGVDGGMPFGSTESLRMRAAEALRRLRGEEEEGGKGKVSYMSRRPPWATPRRGAEGIFARVLNEFGPKWFEDLFAGMPAAAGQVWDNMTGGIPAPAPFDTKTKEKQKKIRDRSRN